MAEYNAAILSISLMTLLGFVDDVIELRWRYKLVIPCIATLPLAQAYWSQHQSTTIVFPSYCYTSTLIQASWGRFWALRKKISRFWAKSCPSSPRSAASPTAQRSISVEQRIGYHLDGWYYIYIVMLCIFCTNSINIYAGINGLEVGQSIVIACSLLFINIVDIIIGGDADYVQNHVFSATMVLPFIAASLALFDFNCYPAKVFVGDTFTYSAGVTFAAVGIFGHFSKSLLLFFIPQLVNFILSLPQLFKVIPCPRHRLPRLKHSTFLL